MWTGAAVLGFGVALVMAPGVASAAPSDGSTESAESTTKASSSARSTLREQRAARVDKRREAVRQRRHTIGNRRPTATPDTAEAAEDGTVRGSLNAVDRDDTALTYSVSSGAAWGSVSVDADGSFVYTPSPGKAGRADSFTVAVDDVPRWRPTEVTIAVPAGDAVDDPAAGPVRTIDGGFTDRRVTGAADAAAVLNGVATTLGAREGFADPDAITVSTVGRGDDAETVYRLSETVAGVPVLGSDVILVTDATGAVTGLFNNYRGLSASFDVTPDVSTPRLRRMADQQLVVYAPLDNRTAPILAWQVVGAVPGVRFSRPGHAVLIGADGAAVGDVIVSRSTIQPVSATDTARDWLGQRRTFAIDVRTTPWSTVSRLIDRDRDITTYKTSFPYFGLMGGFLPGTVVKRGWLGWNSGAVSAHANTAEVYDYYRDVLGRTSFDGAGAAVLVSILYNPGKPNGGYQNAFWDPSIEQFAFGDGGHLEASLDVIGHEFTHAVITYVVGGQSGASVLDYGESGALNEALADIMGVLIENDSGADRWLLAEDSELGAIRNLADPTSISTSLGPHRATYATRYRGTLDDGGEHVNSTIFSHAAYLMMTDPATAGISNDTWAEVFYRAMFRLSAGSVFSDGRAAVQSAAQSVGLTVAQQAAIARAFDSVGISSPATLLAV
ncbi:M4 family metallopeptidase [Mycobacterium sp. PSTR-4-N]|uniref:M4 family metallopeptidase n=1 Tax=Mycobacterium sp. PSTR-4-N TaxID=2917745 RepID=UPI001F155B36|nr:M4 family metallopeptidase [Mycobacterium sp. PSTR-4-N]MCG7595899.1 M4 family metallopeptidase [Mycobacterium sp. PSTR-4-N]